MDDLGVPLFSDTSIYRKPVPLEEANKRGGVCSTGAFKGVFLTSQVCNGRITPVVSNNNKSIIEPKHVVGTYCWIKFDQRNKFAKPAASNRSFGLGRYLKLMFSLARDVASLNIFPLHVSIILFILGSFATWVFPKIGVPQMDGLWWKSLLKWMIWGYIPLFLETPTCVFWFCCFLFLQPCFKVDFKAFKKLSFGLSPASFCTAFHRTSSFSCNQKQMPLSFTPWPFSYFRK